MKHIVDLSSLFWTKWFRSQNIDVAVNDCLEFVKELNGDVVIAADSPPYNREQIDPEYKKNRPEKPAEGVKAFNILKKCIYEDGYTIAKAEGYEADDVIFTIVNMCTEDGEERTVYGVDKDLLQCCDIVDWSGEIHTSQSRLGVHQMQVPDYLALVGDTSDNIKGVKGIGEKTAVALLERYSSIDGIYEALKDDGAFKPSTKANLEAAKEWIGKSLILATLQDCRDTLHYIRKEHSVEEHEMVEPQEAIEAEVYEAEKAAEVEQPKPVGQPISVAIEPVRNAAIEEDRRDYRNSLEPSGMYEAWKISQAFAASGMYQKFKNPEAILVTIMRGRALGLDATTALDQISVIQGKPTMGASLIVALVQSKPVCEYFYCSESSKTKAVWTAKRRGYPTAVSRSFDIEDAKAMGLTSKDNYKKQPAVMLKWRAACALARELFSDVISGLYGTEEME